MDERARALLERTEALAREQLMGLHGTFRGLRPVREEKLIMTEDRDQLFPGSGLDRVSIDGGD